MILRISDSTSFEDAMQDAIAAVEAAGFNTNKNTIALYMEMNNNYTANNSACVDTRVYVDESVDVVSNDIATNN